MDEEPVTPIPHLSDVSSRPRDTGAAARIAQVQRFKEKPNMRQGLCPSCLGSGFVHAERNGVRGVLYQTVRQDQYGRNVDRLVRCACPLGMAKTSGEQEVKQLVDSVDDDE